MGAFLVHVADVIAVSPTIRLGHGCDEHRRVAVPAVNEPGKRFQIPPGPLVTAFGIGLEGRLNPFPE